MNAFKKTSFFLTSIIVFFLLTNCEGLEENLNPLVLHQWTIANQFKGNLDLETLPNYANQTIPGYIRKDNTISNPITDEGAILGRVLFYDKNLSSDNTISCASCHKQELAFGDDLQASEGVNGTTGRHSMRLVNARFSSEQHFFWDERANSLEEQTTQPIQDHIEMGFSGENGDGDINDLIEKLGAIDYYQSLFQFVYGDENITEERIQNALAQFIRSIQSFDSKYDEGRRQAANDNAPFLNFTNQENMGKQLFIAPPRFDQNGIRMGGGLGCNACHRAPEFDIAPNSRNNGVIGALNGEGIDLNITRSPSLRDVVKVDGISNGTFMHTGDFEDLIMVLDHYNQIPITGNNNNLDPRLRPRGTNQNLAMTEEEKAAVIAFLTTLAGEAVYTAEKWSDPF